MQYQLLYEELQGLRALELLDASNLVLLEKKYPSEYLHLRNFDVKSFKVLDEDLQKSSTEILTLYNILTQPLIAIELYDEFVDLLYPTDDEEFTPNIKQWNSAAVSAKPYYNEVNTLNAVQLWNYNHSEPKFIYERMEGVPIEVIYKRGRFDKAIVAGKDVSKNAVYFNGMVKEFDDPMDCVVTGVTLITLEDEPTVKSIIELEKIDVAPTAEAITSQLKGRNEELLEHITFIADNVHIIKFHHTGENIV